MIMNDRSESLNFDRNSDRNLDRNFVSIAQITDTHLFAETERTLTGIPTQASFQAVLNLIQQNLSDLDLLLLTGDLSQDCSPESYQFMRQALESFGKPAYAIAGNHDIIPLMQSHLVSENVHLERSLDFGNAHPWRIIMLNSVIVGAVQGYLDQTELDYLETNLQSHPDQPTLIAFHHPAIAIGTSWMDCISLENKEQFWEICDRYPQVQAVVNGHAHQAFDQVYSTPHNSVRCLVTPSTCVQFQPHSDTFAIDPQSAGFRHLKLYDNGSLETEIYRLPLGKFPADIHAISY